MSATASPLGLIRDKERALAKEIRSAEESAKARGDEAHKRADAILAQAERDGAEEAEKLRQEGLKEARREVQVIESRGESEAAALREAASVRIQTAAQYILRFILPVNEQGGEDKVQSIG